MSRSMMSVLFNLWCILCTIYVSMIQHVSVSVCIHVYVCLCQLFCSNDHHSPQEVCITQAVPDVGQVSWGKSRCSLLCLLWTNRIVVVECVDSCSWYQHVSLTVVLMLTSCHVTCDRQQHTSWWYLRWGSTPSAIMRLELPALMCGTIYHLQLLLRHHWPCSRRIWRRTFFSLTVTDVTSTRYSVLATVLA